MLRYSFKVWLLKQPRLNRLWRGYQARRGVRVGSYADLPGLIRHHANGGSFVDIGCMWGVNGEYAFLAEQAGAAPVKGVDVFGPTPEFEEKKAAARSSVEFILGDACQKATLDRIGPTDTVFCAGVLYHHPSPYDLLVALRSICRKTLILRTSTIPEVAGLPNAAVYYPMLPEHARKQWNLSRLGLMKQVGISAPFEPGQGYGNWFWGITPSCLESMLATAGFRIDARHTEAFAQTVVCTAVANPFMHQLPDAVDSFELGRQVSASGLAKPA